MSTPTMQPKSTIGFPKIDVMHNFIRWAAMALLLVMFSAVAQAQFETTTNNGQVTITKYTGSGGDVDIPDTINGFPVTTIGDKAFDRCTNLTSVKIPSSVTSIAANVFGGCTSLTSFNVSEQNSIYAGVAGILFSHDQTTLIKYPQGKTDISYVVPNSVTMIGENVFDDCDGLTSVTIPESVTSIGKNAFCSTSLSSIIVASLNPFYSSVDGVLFDRDQTTLVRYPQGKAGGSYSIPQSVIHVGVGAFSGCKNLTSLVLPDGVTSVGDYAFISCTSLTGAIIPDSVTSLGDLAFDHCYSLTSVTIGNKVEKIGWEAFQYCHLTSVTIPDSVTVIGGIAFRGDHQLTSVTIGKGVTFIGAGGGGTFADCTSLTNAVFQGNAPRMSGKIFVNTARGFTVYYQNGATGFTSPTWTDSAGDSYPALVSSQSSDTAAQVAASAPASTPDNTNAAAASTTDKLKTLKQLYDQGLITKEVYDQKVKEVLDGM